MANFANPESSIVSQIPRLDHASGLAHTPDREAFGDYLRRLRLAKERENEAFSLRSWSRMVGLSTAYLSNVETNKTKPPLPRHLRVMAALLESDYDEMLAHAGRISDELSDILLDSPAARKIVRSLAGMPEDAREALAACGQALAQESALGGTEGHVGEFLEVAEQYPHLRFDAKLLLSRIARVLRSHGQSVPWFGTLCDGIEEGKAGSRSIRI